MPKNVKVGLFLIYKHAFCCKITKKLKAGRFGTSKKISKTKSHSAEKSQKGLTRLLDRLAHLEIKVKHIAGSLRGLTAYLSKNPVSKSAPIGSYDEQYVINGKLVLLNLSTTMNVSKSHEKKCEGTKQRSVSRKLTNLKRKTKINLKSKRIELNERILFLSTQKTVFPVKSTNYQPATRETEMNIRS